MANCGRSPSRSIGVFLVAAAAILTAAPGRAQPGQVVTTEGPVQGILAEGGEAWEFRGLPYAAPPRGALRFARPRVPAPRSSILDAHSFAPACPQQLSGFQLACGDGEAANQLAGDEDCLALNVLTPAGAWPPIPELPVMVFIHGGAFQTGCARDPNPALALAGPVVLVSIQYRLGQLGFMATEEMAEEDPDGSAGNWALLDMLRSLEWVRDNIAGFGGDPGNVTIFGESAGGLAVCALLASPLADGLFDRAIIQSGNCQAATPLRTTPGSPIAGTTKVEVGSRVAVALGCPPSGSGSLECLRALPFGSLIAANDSHFAAIDGHVLSERPLVVFEREGAGGRAVIVGTNRDEQTVFTNFDAALVARIEGDYEGVVREQLGERLADQLLPLYPTPQLPSERLAQYNRLFGELSFNCPAVDTVDALARTGSSAYLYHFTQTIRNFFLFGEELGSFHALELFYVFGNLNQLGALFFFPAPGDFALASVMQASWTSFARTGSPDILFLGWPLYDPVEPRHLELKVPFSSLSVRDVYRDGSCDAQIAAIEEVDSDRDFVLDEFDNCPGFANSDQFDRDGDTAGDSCDLCPDSLLSPTLVFGRCDSEVANRAVADGCTLEDVFARCQQRPAPDRCWRGHDREKRSGHGHDRHDRYDRHDRDDRDDRCDREDDDWGHRNPKRCVKKLAKRLERQGILDRAERRAIKRCAGRGRR